MAIYLKRIILAGIISNAIETYDLSIYAFFTIYLAKIFFPNQNDYLSLLNIFGIFLFGYLSRPLGSIIFGYIGDLYGRRIALISSSFLMMLSTGIMGILPGYESFGYFSAFLLLLLRIAQGISYGGEYTGSVIYLVEHANKNKTNTYGSIAAMGSNLGILISSLVCLLITMNFSTQQIDQWVWRIPFLLSLIFSLICFTLRSFLEEPAKYQQVLQGKHKDLRSLTQLIKSHKNELLVIFTLTCFGIVTTYLLFIYLTTYLVKVVHYKTSTALTLNTLSLALLVSIIPFAGRVADRFARNNIILACVISLAVLILPYLYILSTDHYILIALLQIAITVPAAFYFATVPVLLVEIIKMSVRYRTVSLGYNFAAAIFGGTMPIITVTLVEKTQLSFMPGIYLILCATITILMMSSKKDYLTISA